MAFEPSPPAEANGSSDTALPPERGSPMTSSGDYHDDEAGPSNTETIKPNAGPAHPTHYLCRGNGRFTPLIALDELPSHLKIVGHPLSLSFKDIVDVGGVPLMPAVEKAGESYLVVLESASAVSSSHLLPTPDLNHSVDIPSSGTINARISRAIDGVGASSDPEKLKVEILKLKAKNTANNQRYNPTTPGVLGQKVYCTHWMRTGECDFTQQGCMFLHAMPDLDTLELLGFRSYPRWFREMPRHYQLENAKDFNPVGLDQHRHSQKVGYHGEAANGQWYSQSSRYVTARGPPNAGYQFGPQATPAMPMHPGPWSSNGFNQSHLPTPPRQSPDGSFGNGYYNHQSTPVAPGNVGPYQPPPAVMSSIWSRTTSPSMDAINRMHKPLTPEVTAQYPAPSTPAFSVPPSLGSPMTPTFSLPQAAFNRAGGLDQNRQQNKQIQTGTSKGLKSDNTKEDIRSKHLRRSSPKTPTKSVNKNPFAALDIEGSSGSSSTGTEK